MMSAMAGQPEATHWMWKDTTNMVSSNEILRVAMKFFGPPSSRSTCKTRDNVISTPEKSASKENLKH
jgi:hypothetical protein